jgi:hypothetical protein
LAMWASKMGLSFSTVSVASRLRRKHCTQQRRAARAGRHASTRERGGRALACGETLMACGETLNSHWERGALVKIKNKVRELSR